MGQKYKWPITEVEISKVDNILITYSDHLDDMGHVSILDWQNGEGLDIEVNCGLNGHSGNGHISISWSQWECIKKAVKLLLQRE